MVGISNLGDRADTVMWRVLLRETVEIDAEPVSLNARPRSVLLCLLTRPNEVTSTGAIVDFVWGEHPPKTAVNSIARFVADIRKSLGVYRERIETVPGGYRVLVHPDELDIDVAEKHLADADRVRLVDHKRSCDYARAGLAVVGTVRNPALGETPAALAITQIHDELRVSLLELFGEVALRQGTTLELVSTLEEAVRNHRFNERLWIHLMTALKNSQRFVEALRAGQRARQALADVGLEPGQEFRLLESDIVDAGVSSRPAAPDVRSETVATPIVHSPHGIREPTTRLIGRAVELRELARHATHQSLVSIVGLGGSGKTRVGLALVRSLESNGIRVFRVGLRSTTEDRLVVSTIASALGVPTGQAPDVDSLAMAISRDSFVLLLDNCEHVHAACRAVAMAIGQHAPAVTIIATSRRALGVPAEHVFQLGMLAVPEDDEVSADVPAVTMLIDRAEPHMEAAPDSSGGLDHLCQIARLLNGHPLATEVAAAQLAYMTIEELHTSLSAAVTAGGQNDDQTVAALVQVMDWSWDTLTPSQRSVLARLAVFGGSWTLDAAHALNPEHDGLADDVAALQANGLVTASTVGHKTRFEMLEPARGYALERLGDRAEVNAMFDRVVQWLMDLAQVWTVADQHTRSASSTRLFQEHGNVTAALNYLYTNHRTAELCQLSINYSGMLINHGFADEVTRWLGPLVENEGLTNAARSGAAAMVLAASHATGDLDVLQDVGMRSIELADGQPHDWIPAVASFLALWALFTPGTMTTDELFTVSDAASDGSVSQTTNRSISQLYRAHVAFCMRRYDDAAAAFSQILERSTQPGRLTHVAEVGLSLSHMLAGETELARSTADAWVSRGDTDEWHYMVDIARAVVHGGTGTPEQGTADLAAALRDLPTTRIWGRTDEIQIAFGMLALLRGEHSLADQLLDTVVTRDVLLTVTAVELLARRAGTLDDMAWFGIAEEFWTRVLPDSGYSHATVASTPELVSWWLVGSDS